MASIAVVPQAYRTRKPFAAVHFDEASKGRIVFLPQGAEVRVIGPSSIGKCIEVMFEKQRYNIFKVDLFGQAAIPAYPANVKAIRTKPIRTFSAVACA
jgi:hypothetical protein